MLMVVTSLVAIAIVIRSCGFLHRKRILLQTQGRGVGKTMLEKYEILKRREGKMNATFDVPDLLPSDVHGSK